ncbi:MAG: DUF1573 domain-containing protein [Sphingobacteriales bacterium]|jgi:hypothetical protein|nr:DUF1573 domain-containing protein [Sphingobacteriales bacterium]MDA0197529.1 DUF1573 domain-containing protein [Bacteroidota bacterium]
MRLKEFLFGCFCLSLSISPIHAQLNSFTGANSSNMQNGGLYRYNEQGQFEDIHAAIASLPYYIYKAGEVNLSEEIVINFPVYNKGNETLKINTVEDGCGCGEVSFTQGAIAPQSVGFISVHYEPNALNEGDFLKRLYVQTNALEPQILLYIQGRGVYRENKEVEEIPVYGPVEIELYDYLVEKHNN